MKILTIVSLLVSMNCFALSKEDIKRIKENNAKAQQSIYTNGHNYANKENANVESEVVSQKAFKKHQKEQAKKKIKVPHIRIANDYIKNHKRFMGKKYKVLVIGDTMAGANGSSKACAFTYLKLVGGTGFEKEMGKGRYYFQSLKGLSCNTLIEMVGDDMSALTLIVQFIGIDKIPENPSKVEPLFNIVGVE